MAIDGYEPDPSIKAEPIQKTPQRNERRSGDRNHGNNTKSPRRSHSPAAKAGGNRGSASTSPWKSAQKKVSQGRKDS